VEFSIGGSENSTLVRETEESPMLEVSARERLVKIQQTGKCLAGSVVICELWRLAMTL
jgi:hypothetical protein